MCGGAMQHGDVGQTLAQAPGLPGPQEGHDIAGHGLDPFASQPAGGGGDVPQAVTSAVGQDHRHFLLDLAGRFRDDGRRLAAFHRLRIGRHEFGHQIKRQTLRIEPMRQG